jgi:hypothetical protein
MFMINRSLNLETATDLYIYRATQGSWVIGEHARNQAVHALGVSHGVVRGAYRIEGWRSDDGRRWTFDGRSAPELDAVGKSIARLKPPQGASNPVRIFLQGIGADSEIE